MAKMVVRIRMLMKLRKMMQGFCTLMMMVRLLKILLVSLFSKAHPLMMMVMISRKMMQH
jgi:hypothetical protein